MSERPNPDNDEELDRPCLEECIPGLADAQTCHEKADALLRAIADPSITDAEDDIDLIVDNAFYALIHIDDLPDHTVDVMQSLLAYKDHIDQSHGNQMKACDVLAHMGERAKKCLPTLHDNLPLAESDHDADKALALRSARAIWKISGDPTCAMEVTHRLLQGEEDWIVNHAQRILDEIGSHK